MSIRISALKLDNNLVLLTVFHVQIVILSLLISILIFKLLILEVAPLYLLLQSLHFLLFFF